MAAKKTIDEEVTEVKQEAKKEVAKTEVDPWSVMKTIVLPRATDGSANFRFVSVNGRNFKVLRGQPVSVPLPVADVLQHSLDAEEEAIRFIESLEG